MLERGSFPRDKVCGDFVNARGLRQLESLGCFTEQDARTYTPIRHSSTWLGEQLLATAPLPTIAGLPDRGHVIPRRELDDRVVRAALDRGAALVDGCQVTSVVRNGARYQVRGSAGGHRVTFEADFLVGADGAQSFVSKAMGLRSQDPRYVVAAQRAYCHGLTLDETIVRFDESAFPAFGWIFPIRAGLCNVGVGVLAESSRKFQVSVREVFEGLRKFIELRAAERGERVEIESPRGWPIKVFGGPQRMVFERGLLVGEAAAQVDPVSGEGIPLALQMSEVAAEVIPDALARNETRALHRYESTWRERYARDLRLCDLLVTVTRNHHLQTSWRAGMRAVAEVATRDPEYARVVGGVFAGLLPARELLDPRIAISGLLHAPHAVLASLAGNGSSALAELGRLQLDQLRALMAMLADREWTHRWLQDVRDKQNRVTKGLSRGPW